MRSLHLLLQRFADARVDFVVGTPASPSSTCCNILGVGNYERLQRNAIEIALFGRSFRVISLEDLIAAKEAMGREKDLLAVKELRALAAKRAPG